MVHALKEVWRVLAQDGCLLDSRQIANYSRVEIVVGEQVRLAGAADDSAWLPDDVACDRALAQVVSEGWFAFERKVFLDTAAYYDSIDTLRKRCEVNKALVSESVLAKAQELLTQGGANAQVRWNTKTLVARYCKLSR